MNRPDDRRRKPKELSPTLRKIEKVCARMNGALMAVAIALAILVTLTAAMRAPVLFPASPLATNAEPSGDD